MKKFENLIEERNKLKDASEGKKIMERKKIEKKIESILEHKENGKRNKTSKKKSKKIYRY